MQDVIKSNKSNGKNNTDPDILSTLFSGIDLLLIILKFINPNVNFGTANIQDSNKKAVNLIIFFKRYRKTHHYHNFSNAMISKQIYFD